MGENEVLKGQDGLEYPLFFFLEGYWKIDFRNQITSRPEVGGCYMIWPTPIGTCWFGVSQTMAVETNLTKKKTNPTEPLKKQQYVDRLI